MTLRLRLGLWYGGLTGAVVVLVCLYSYAVHSRVHYDALDRTLRRAAAHVADELRETEPAQYGDVLAASQHLGTAVRLLDDAGRSVLASPNAASLPSIPLREVLTSGFTRPYPTIARLVPSSSVNDSISGSLGLLRAADGLRWRVFVTRVQASGSFIAVLQPMAEIDASVRHFGWLMVFMALVGGLLTFSAGWLVASRALRPIAMLTGVARSISRSQTFARRVPVLHPRDELGQLATTFNEMLASLETAYAAQHRFVADASHELRAPLAVVKANLEILSRHTGLAADERERALWEASAEAERLTRLVTDLLALARADAGQQIRRAPVELDRLLMNVLGEARHLAQGQRLSVGALEPVMLEGDADHLKQLLLILLDNAIKFTGRSGRIVVGLVRAGADARLTVRDTGAGIPPDSLPHVFERFYRASLARSNDPGGTGLGLPIARWIVEQHGGSITIESKLGHGTTVVVTLPV